MQGFLGPDEVSGYRTAGFHFPIAVLSAAEAATHVTRLGDFEEAHGPMHYRVKPYLIFTSAWEIATHPALLDAVESVLGPDILLWDSSYVIKEPGSSSIVSWHQDLTYWGLDMNSDDDLVSAWVALTPADCANGAMRFVRGSHRQGRFNHADTYDRNNILHRGQTITDQFDDADIVQMQLAAGQASFHHGWAVHASGQNTTPSRRVGIVMNYVRPGVRQVVGDVESATLVRGEDRHRNFRSEPECERDFAPTNVAFQEDVERRKREVYDRA